MVHGKQQQHTALEGDVGLLLPALDEVAVVQRSVVLQAALNRYQILNRMSELLSNSKDLSNVNKFNAEYDKRLL